MCPGCKKERSRRAPPLDITVPKVVGDPRCTEKYIEGEARLKSRGRTPSCDRDEEERSYARWPEGDEF